MTLAQMVSTYPRLFYQQTWYVAERFVQAYPVALPDNLTAWSDDVEPRLPVSAADLAAAYVKDPANAIWRKFLWTDDTDDYGNRVYVGGVGQYGIDRWQVHRALTPECYYVRAA